MYAMILHSCSVLNHYLPFQPKALVIEAQGQMGAVGRDQPPGTNGVPGGRGKDGKYAAIHADHSNSDGFNSTPLTRYDPPHVLMLITKWCHGCCVMAIFPTWCHGCCMMKIHKVNKMKNQDLNDKYGFLSVYLSVKKNMSYFWSLITSLFLNII
jgi:hypothetical protein